MRNKRRNFNEGQRQILSKGDLKRYKGEDDHSTSDQDNQSNKEDGPEEISRAVPINRRSKIVKDADVLRFSKASSLD